MNSEELSNGGQCSICNKLFANRKLRNRHIKRVHKLSVSLVRETSLLCPLCQKNNITYNELRNHLQYLHGIENEEVQFEFSSLEEFQMWKDTEKIETTYAIDRNINYKKYKEIHYACNRSKTRKFVPLQQQRTEKAGGTIKINGICPSKVVVKVFETQKVTVTFWKSHAGHVKDELRTKHLSKLEKDDIIKKLVAGVPASRILDDSRKMDTPKLERINLLNKKDINYLVKEHNIEKRRDQNDFVAVRLKVEEWNANGKNFAFLFKPEGELHDVLKKEDFALGFMNKVMEEKLQSFPKIICMDGTHGTNKKGLDLTIILIKDERNAGFPVAFFLSNRLDQQIQEVFLEALKNKLGRSILADFFMSDDDPKYYNAWVKTMDVKPRRLLCSWHVVKSWNIQGKRKIKDLDLRQQMKNEMKKILNETNEERFIYLTNTYFSKLQESNEIEFLSYLQKYYYQDEDRIKMWAHCYRRNSGINTNMAIEALNNLLKTNQLKRRTNITNERLLDAIDDLVDIKMWKRILSIQRPDANNYQDRVIIKAHSKAVELLKCSKIEEGDAFGEFKVQSSKGETWYTITANQLCEKQCKTLYCRVCKICIHRYQCTCPEYQVKNTLCKHIHFVKMHEHNSNSILDDFAETLGRKSLIEQQEQEEISKFINTKLSNQKLPEGDLPTKIKMEREELHKWIDNLGDDAFKRFLGNIQEAISNENQIAEKDSRTTKRKMEKQAYFPHSKYSINKRQSITSNTTN